MKKPSPIAICKICICLILLFGSFLSVNAQVFNDIGVTSSSNWLSYMNVFENHNGRSPFGSESGSAWATESLRTSFRSKRIALVPNTNDFSDSLGYSNFTAGIDSNTFINTTIFKFMNTTIFIEHTDGENPYSKTGNTHSISRTSRSASVKNLEVNNRYNSTDRAIDSITASGDFYHNLKRLEGK